MKKATSIESLRSERLELLKEEIRLCQMEEIFEKIGNPNEALSYKKERDQLYVQRMAIEERLKFYKVEKTA
jgi:hypothetical protein